MIEPNPTSAGRQNYFDVARALAAFMVIAVHTEQNFHATTPLVSTFAEMGQLGVQLFFLVSAFLIFDSLERLRRNGGSLLEYFIHRFLRIAPLYYVAIVSWTLIKRIAEPAMPWDFGATPAASYTLPNVLCNLLLVHGLVPSANNSIVGGGWSIGTEFLFYVLAPLMFVWRSTPTRIACAAAICLPLVLAGAHYLQPLLDQPQYVVDNGFLYFSIVNQFPVFACGMLLYCYRDSIFRLSHRAVAAGIVVPAVVMYWIWQNHFSDRLTFFFVPLFAAASFMFLIVLLARAPCAPRAISMIGQRSFSIYLLNAPMILIVKNICHGLGGNLSFPVALLIVTASTFTFSGFTYRLIEKPFINLAKRLFARSSVAANQRFCVDPRQ